MKKSHAHFAVLLMIAVGCAKGPNPVLVRVGPSETITLREYDALIGAMSPGMKQRFKRPVHRIILDQLIDTWLLSDYAISNRLEIPKNAKNAFERRIAGASVAREHVKRTLLTPSTSEATAYLLSHRDAVNASLKRHFGEIPNEVSQMEFVTKLMTEDRLRQWLDQQRVERQVAVDPEGISQANAN